jgi:hypothetical protein
MNDCLSYQTSMIVNSLPDEENCNYPELLRHLTSEFNRPSTGWNFSCLKGRMEEQLNLLPWDYEATVRSLLLNARGLLDMGTGSGEFLASLSPLPPDTCATEGWAPNIAIARQRLGPLGVTVTGTVFMFDIKYVIVISRDAVDNHSARFDREITDLYHRISN